MVSESKISGWFTGRVPDDWFSEPPEISVDRDEILVVGRIEEPDLGDHSDETDDSDETEDRDDVARAAACRARIKRFREDTRDDRIAIAEEAEAATGQKVAWGARCGDEYVLFTHLAVPVMTRLRMAERQTLDTLVSGGVARSRSDALAWCVKLVSRHEADWIDQLREALVGVEEARAAGPSS